MEEVVDYLAMGFINTYQNFQPDLIVASGLLINANPYFSRFLPKRIKEKSAEPIKDAIKVKFSHFVELAPVYGALAHTKIKAGLTKIKDIF